PQGCLALSGGGLRSAAFSIGVMMGLEEKEGLEQFDVISAVSGGSYALSWVYTQRLLGVKEMKTTLSTDAKMSGQVVGESSVEELGRKVRIANRVTYVFMALIDLLASPINLIANGFFGWHANTTPSRAWYESRLRETFMAGQSPEALRFAKFRTLLADRSEQKLPLVVINAT